MAGTKVTYKCSSWFYACSALAPALTPQVLTSNASAPGMLLGIQEQIAAACKQLFMVSTPPAQLATQTVNTGLCCTLHLHLTALYPTAHHKQHYTLFAWVVIQGDSSSLVTS